MLPSCPKGLNSIFGAVIYTNNLNGVSDENWVPVGSPTYVRRINTFPGRPRPMFSNNPYAKGPISVSQAYQDAILNAQNNFVSNDAIRLVQPEPAQLPSSNNFVSNDAIRIVQPEPAQLPSSINSPVASSAANFHPNSPYKFNTLPEAPKQFYNFARQSANRIPFPQYNQYNNIY